MQTLNIKQIESVLPQIRNLLNLVEAHNTFHNIGYKNNSEENGMTTLAIVLQNIQAQGKDCSNYNEELFVIRFNKGTELISIFAKYMNWHFPSFIENELKMITCGVLYEEN